MKELLDKISSYNLFNYLLPGVLFCLIATHYFDYPLIQENLFVGAFLYYFVGLIISRFGSLIIEPVLKKVKFVKFSEYSDFLSASKKDTKIELLSEANNMFRTLCSLFVIILLLDLYGNLESQITFLKDCRIVILTLLLIIIFLLSYRKQTNYINKRIEANK